MSVQVHHFNKNAKPVAEPMPLTKEAFLKRKKELEEDIEKSKYMTLTWLKRKTIKTIDEILHTCFGC